MERSLYDVKIFYKNKTEIIQEKFRDFVSDIWFQLCKIRWYFFFKDEGHSRGFGLKNVQIWISLGEYVKKYFYFNISKYILMPL